MEIDGGGEKREREEGDGTVVIGHHSFDRTVVGDADVA